MAFFLKNVVPWGRNLNEYRKMFQLSEEDFSRKIISFGDGPASFNSEAAGLGCHITSIDPIYQYTRAEIEKRIDETKSIVMEQTKNNINNFVWTQIKDPSELERIRLTAMKAFLADYERGKTEKRYICHELPDRTAFHDNAFDIGLSSHFLLLYPALGYDFHIGSINEMLRICKEVRIFPMVDLDGKKTELTNNVIEHFNKSCHVKIISTSYEFQKGGNQMLSIKKKEMNA